MKKLVSVLMVLALSISMLAVTAGAAPIEKVTIGTTSVIEVADSSEYAYEMLSCGVSAMPLVCQDTTGVACHLRNPGCPDLGLHHCGRNALV